LLKRALPAGNPFPALEGPQMGGKLYMMTKAGMRGANRALDDRRQYQYRALANALMTGGQDFSQLQPLLKPIRSTALDNNLFAATPAPLMQPWLFGGDR